MGQAYKEMARIILAGMVMVALLVFVAGSVLLPGLGERMDVPGAEYATYQDFAQTMDVCGREAPEIIRIGLWKWKAGEEISISQVFSGMDVEGNAVDVKVLSLWDEEKNSRMEFYRKEGNSFIISEKGVYFEELQAVDREYKTAVRRFALLVGGGK